MRWPLEGEVATAPFSLSLLDSAGAKMRGCCSHSFGGAVSLFGASPSARRSSPRDMFFPVAPHRTVRATTTQEHRMTENTQVTASSQVQQHFMQKSNNAHFHSIYQGKLKHILVVRTIAKV